MFPLLPPELHLQIFSHLQTPESLHALTLVNHATNALATPLLYRRLEPQQDTAHLLVRALLGRPELGGYVKEVALNNTLLSPMPKLTGRELARYRPERRKFRTIWAPIGELPFGDDEWDMLREVQSRFDKPQSETAAGASSHKPVRLTMPWMWALIVRTPSLPQDVTATNVPIAPLPHPRAQNPPDRLAQAHPRAPA
ncbi:hypothetical protein BJ508DRAFT_9894 [Ascobolus immersus RN42]|uniref:F-box domain-containing protein n=1 Tax=Ascobolus immersus RN42 TaxID=1160509 RepID=A0A3N4HWP6_ASCIM|nr:hypothetical protein BJ508DRAFT_9894 [Ascobolus immersus RN42]